MGEVWCATDTNLGRQVAIKILPDAFAQDPDRLARFEREAKTLRLKAPEASQTGMTPMSSPSQEIVQGLTSHTRTVLRIRR
jgi:eukaryotic-like serine/threonine-protein kinase